MAKFVYRMQQWLNIKSQLENVKKNELSNALRRVESEKEVLKSLEDEKHSHIEQVKEYMVKGISVRDLRQYSTFFKFFELKINNQKKVVNDVSEIADKVREELVQTSKEKKMLEILKEKKFEEYKIAEEKKSELEIAEIASYKYLEHKVGIDNGSH